MTSRNLFRITFTLSLLHVGFLQATPPCPQGHCGSVNAQINASCIALGLSGKPFPVIGPTGDVCTCPCSCVIAGTLIDTADGPIAIENLREGMSLLQVSGEKHSITRMLSSELEQPHPVYRITFNNKTELVVSENHTFITATYSVIRADQLQMGTLVLDRHNGLVSIKSIRQEQYQGALYNVIIQDQSPHAYSHVVVTNGIQSGDFLLQATMDALRDVMDLRTAQISARLLHKA